MVHTKEAVEKRQDTSDADPSGQEAKLDLAEELYVSCRFTEAARVCTEALSSGPSKAPSASSRNSNSSGSIIGRDPAGLAPMVAFDDQMIAPVGECDTPDLIVAVLLQCGFELQRTEEWGRCRAFYSATGAIPFAVAILWLRLRLACGEFELVRRVLWQLREALGNMLHRTTAVNANNTNFEAVYGRQAQAAAMANYSEATEMLVVQVMLPFGESTEAVALVLDDAYLDPKEKGQVLKTCEQSASEVERVLGEAVGGGAEGNARSMRAGSIGYSHSSYRGVRRREAMGGPQRGRETRFESFEPPDDDSAARRRQQQQQGPVQKFFSDVSDLTPEARIQILVGAGAAGLAAYVALRNRDYLWRAARSAAGVAARTAGDVGSFIVGSS